MMAKVKPGPIDTVVLFGGGLLLLGMAKWAIQEGLRTVVFAVRRHLDEIIDSFDSKSMKDRLVQDQIEFYHEKDINHSEKLIEIITDRTMGIGVGEAYRFNQHVIDRFHGRLYDFMVIPLPKYRGGAHFSWQILTGDSIGCWKIQRINEKMIPGVFDSGEILMEHRYRLPDWVRLPRDYFKVSEDEGLRLFMRFLEKVQDGGEFSLSTVEESQSTYFPRLSTEKQGWIDWSWSTLDIERFICAFDDPYRGASTQLNGRRVYLKDCKIQEGDGPFHPFMAGLIYRVHENQAYVASSPGGLRIGTIQGEGGETLNSYLRPGNRLKSPQQALEDAMFYVAEYDTEGLVSDEMEMNYGLYD